MRRATPCNMPIRKKYRWAADGPTCVICTEYVGPSPTHLVPSILNGPNLYTPQGLHAHPMESLAPGLHVL